MKNKFRIGDRVAVYATLNGTMVRSLGTVRGIAIDTGRLALEMDVALTSSHIYAHPKQCRKIKLEQLWFNKNSMDIALEPQDSCGWVRYVRAKKQ